jgi:hypothetical protein
LGFIKAKVETAKKCPSWKVIDATEYLDVFLDYGGKQQALPLKGTDDMWPPVTLESYLDEIH